MLNRKQKLVIGEDFITAWSINVQVLNGIQIFIDPATQVSWDEIPEDILTTVPALFENRSWISAKGRQEGRTVEITLTAIFEDPNNIRALRSSFEYIKRTNTFNGLSMVYYLDNEETFKEVYPATRLTGATFELIADNVYRIVANFYTANPYKTVYLNGSTTPQEVGRF